MNAVIPKSGTGPLTVMPPRRVNQPSAESTSTQELRLPMSHRELPQIPKRPGLNDFGDMSNRSSQMPDYTASGINALSLEVPSHNKNAGRFSPGVGSRYKVNLQNKTRPMVDLPEIPQRNFQREPALMTAPQEVEEDGEPMVLPIESRNKPARKVGKLTNKVLEIRMPETAPSAPAKEPSPQFVAADFPSLGGGDASAPAPVWAAKAEPSQPQEFEPVAPVPAPVPVPKEEVQPEVQIKLPSEVEVPKPSSPEPALSDTPTFDKTKSSPSNFPEAKIFRSPQASDITDDYSTRVVRIARLNQDNAETSAWTRETLLCYRLIPVCLQVPEEMANVRSQSFQGGHNYTKQFRKDRDRGESSGFSRAAFGSNKQYTKDTRGKGRGKDAPSIKPSETGYKTQKPKSRNEELTRIINSWLNKIAPENFNRILGHFSQIDLGSSKDFELAIDLILDKVLTQPHYCETYCDLVYYLRQRFPEPQPGDESGARTFRAIVVDICQREFEEHPTDKPISRGEDESKLEFEERYSRIKKRALANMKFIGHLFLRKLLANKVIFMIVMQLLKNAVNELSLEQVCTLLSTIGFTCEDSEQGRTFLTAAFGRLQELKVEEEAKPQHNKRIIFMIQDTLDLRKNKWQMRQHKEVAKTIKEVHDQAYEDTRGYQAVSTTVAVSTVGQRPAYLTQRSTNNKMMQFVNRTFKRFSTANIDKVLSYFAEERDADSMLQDWLSLGLQDGDLDKAIQHLVDKGINDVKHHLVVASMFVLLLEADRISWDQLIIHLKDPMKQLADIAMDTPSSAKFYVEFVAQCAKCSTKTEIEDGRVKLDIPPDFWCLLPEDSTYAAKILSDALRSAKSYRDLTDQAMKVISKERPDVAKLI